MVRLLLLRAIRCFLLGALIISPVSLAQATPTNPPVVKKAVKKTPPKNKKSKPVVNFSFFRAGVVNRIYVKRGDQVINGQLLADLTNHDLLAQLAQTKALVEVQKNRLEESKSGGRPENVKSEKLKVKTAKDALADAQRALIDAIQSAFTYADDAVRAKVGQFFDIAHNGSAQITFNTDVQLNTSLIAKRNTVESILNNWRVSFANLNLSSDLDSYTYNARIYLAQVRDLLDGVAYVLNGFGADSGFKSADLRNWRSDMTTARTNVDTVAKNLSTAESKMHDVQAKATTAESDFTLKVKPATPAELAFQKGKIEELQAKIESLLNQINQSELHSAQAGKITSIKVRNGQTVTANAPVIILEPENKIQAKSLKSLLPKSLIEFGNRS